MDRSRERGSFPWSEQWRFAPLALAKPRRPGRRGSSGGDRCLDTVPIGTISSVCKVKTPARLVLRPNPYSRLAVMSCIAHVSAAEAVAASCPRVAIMGCDNVSATADFVLCHLLLAVLVKFHSFSPSLCYCCSRHDPRTVACSPGSWGVSNSVAGHCGVCHCYYWATPFFAGVWASR